MSLIRSYIELCEKFHKTTVDNRQLRLLAPQCPTALEDIHRADTHSIIKKTPTTTVSLSSATDLPKRATTLWTRAITSCDRYKIRLVHFWTKEWLRSCLRHRKNGSVPYVLPCFLEHGDDVADRKQSVPLRLAQYGMYHTPISCNVGVCAEVFCFDSADKRWLVRVVS